MTYWLFQKKVKDSVGVEICSDAQHLGQADPGRGGVSTRALGALASHQEVADSRV